MRKYLLIFVGFMNGRFNEKNRKMNKKGWRYFMAGGKCKSCGNHGEYVHYDGTWVCEECVGGYFTCPDCGRVFDMDDYENGDAGNGFCRECAPEH